MVAENVQNIRRRIALACERSGRSPGDVTLIAVTKDIPGDTVREIISAGVSDIGENYVQELKLKKDEIPGNGVRWHFIGHLQTNKVKDIAPWIHAVHSVDSLRLASEISRRALAANRTIAVLVEVNTSGEATKFGLTPEEAPAVVREIIRLPAIELTGLMTIGPLTEDPEGSRGAFRTLAGLRERLADEGMTLRHLSMGMSDDFEAAIEEGATMVRIGRAIAGPRVRQRQP